MCTQWSGAGILGDCLVSEGMADISACGPDAQDPFCLSNPYGSSGVCSYTCESLCDCPAPPEGFEAQYTCGDLTGDSTGECHLACGPTTPCPDDMLCFYNTVCHYGTPVPTYGDCVNEFGLPCADGDCLVDAAMPTLGVCGGFCDDASQCPVPETGDAEVTCIDVGGAMNECVLDCSAGQTCPDGMSCDEGACVWLVGG